jgi:nucleoside-diphosphate-sugar epimerase
MRIALTGGSGGVGSATIEMALKAGHTIVSIDRVQPSQALPTGVDFIEASITDYDALVDAFRGCDALIHLAAIPSPDEHPNHVVHNNNVVGSYNALRAAAEVGIKRVAQASSVNAIGAVYSREVRFDYFPIDERHPSYAEDPYSLSKWICEQQADAFVRRYDMTIASLRFHWVVTNRQATAEFYLADMDVSRRHLWSYTPRMSAASSCLLGISADFTGHEVFFIMAPDTALEIPSLELAKHYHPTVPIRGNVDGTTSLITSEKARRILGWTHELSE